MMFQNASSLKTLLFAVATALFALCDNSTLLKKLINKKTLKN